MKITRGRGPWIAALLGWAVVVALGLAPLLAPPGVIAQVTGPFFAPNGSPSSPAYTYSTSPRLGRYRIERDNEGFVTDGQLRWHYTAAALHLVSGLKLRADGVFSQGAVGVGTDNPTSALHVIGALAATGNLSVGGTTHVTGTLTSGLAVLNVHAVNIAPDGTTNGNAEILSGAVAPVLRITCNDAEGCTLRFSETGVVAGTILRIVNLGPQSILVGDHATVGTRQHLASSGALTGTANATLQLIYMTVHATGTEGWYELSRSVN